eukprot:GSChrysophyteH1.ASY1.ANO1.1990.1 assembled CDS
MNIEQGTKAIAGKRDDSSVSTQEQLIGYGAADVTHGGVHSGPITSVGTAHQRPIVATFCSDDNTVRIWNYETYTCEVVHHFGGDEPLAIDVHNNGLYMIVSFKDRVRGYNIAMSSLIPHCEVIQKGCKEIKFSHGGDYFACASGINLVVFRTSTFTQVVTFQGHMMPIKKIAWAPGDLVIFSASVDGCVYGWPTCRDGRLDIVASNPRASTVLSIEVDSSSLVFLPPLADVGDDGAPVVRQEEDRYLLLSTASGMINMPAWAFTNSSWDHVSNPNHIIWGEESCAITCQKLSANRRHLYAGTKAGKIRIYAWPPINKSKVGIYSEFSAHRGAVVTIHESPRGDKLLTMGEDGAVMVFTLNKAPWTKIPQVLLLSTEDMDEHIEEVTSLNKRLRDLEASSQYKLSQLQTSARENERRMAESFDQTLNDERDRYEQLRGEFDEKVKSLLTTIETKETESLKVVADLENRYEHKLSDQLDRYDKLAEEMELLRQKCEGLLLSDRNDFTKQLNDTINNARLREKKMRNENKRITDDRASDEAAFKEILDQQEHEYEDELRQLISAAEGELIVERENIGKLRTLVQTKNTKLDQLKKKLIELSVASKARASLLNNEKNETKKLLETIEHYKKNLVEREEVVAEKEKIIIELRSKTRTLENFRFVLDHRLQQLSAERGPIASHIEGLERHISTMYEELVEEFENKKENEIQKEKTEQRNHLVMEDLKETKKALRKSERSMNAFKRELGNIVTAMVIGKELEESVRLLYRKYVKGEIIGETTVKASEQATLAASALLNKKADDMPGMSSPGGGGSPGHGGKGKAFALEVEETLIESAKEAERQKISKGKEASQLKHRLESTRQEALVTQRKRLSENSNLLFEVNDLRKDVRKGERKLFERDETIKQLQHELREMKRKIASGKIAIGYTGTDTGTVSKEQSQALSMNRIDTPNITETFGAPAAEVRPPQGKSMSNTRVFDEKFMEERQNLPEKEGLVDATEEQQVIQPRVVVGNLQQEQPQIQRSQSESVLKKIQGAGIDARNTGGTPKNTWMIHNAMNLNKAKSEVAFLQGTEDITVLEGQAWKPQTTNNLGTTQLAKAAQAQKGGLDVSKPAASVKDRKRKGASVEATQERQIQVLKEQQDALMWQLDESTRLRENQRVEISQLRKQLMRANGLGFVSAKNTGMTTSNQNNQFQHGAVANSFTDDIAIQMSDEFAGSQFQGGSVDAWNADQGSLVLNNEQIRVSRSLTTADRTGKPSDQDLQDMRLGVVEDPDNPAYPNKGTSKSKSQGSRGHGGDYAEESKTISLPSIKQQPINTLDCNSADD